MKILLVFILAFVAFTSVRGQIEDSKHPIIDIPELNQRLHGVYVTSVNPIMKRASDSIEKSTAVFLNIPYAKPPVGKLRFRAPVPLDRSSEKDVHSIRDIDATRMGNICVQPISPIMRDVQESEDCLNLNVWVPKSIVSKVVDNTQPKPSVPVLVFVHGGGFQVGSGVDEYIDGVHITSLEKSPMIFVTFNYRLGPLGFLAHRGMQIEDENAPANHGMLDQRLALQYVKSFIHHFGGDPSRITISGESAGGIAVLWHLATSPSPVYGELFEQAQQDHRRFTLFTRVIAQSPVMGFSSVLSEGQKDSTNYAERLGCEKGKKPVEVIECLRQLTTNQLMGGFNGFGKNRSVYPTANGAFPFWPVVDGKVFKVPPEDEFDKNGASIHDELEMIIGTTEDEATLFSFVSFPIIKITSDLFLDATKKVFGKHSDAIIEKYMKSSNGDGHAASDRINADFLFERSATIIAKSLAKTNHSVYKYRWGITPSTGASQLGAFHSAELQFIFGINPGGFLYSTSFTSLEYEASNRIMNLWVEFCYNGTFDENVWKKYGPNKNDQYVKTFRIPVDEISLENEETYNFWRKIYPGKFHFNAIEHMTAESLFSYIVNVYIAKAFFILAFMGKWALLLAALIVVILYQLFSRIFLRRKNPKQKTN